MQGNFLDLRMQDAYNVVKCLQDLACASCATAAVFVSCGGLSNLAAVLSWPAEGMRHARWAASVVMTDVSVTFGPDCWAAVVTAGQRCMDWLLPAWGCRIQACNLRGVILCSARIQWRLLMAARELRCPGLACAGRHQGPAAGDLRQLASGARQRAGGQLPGDRAEPLQRARQGLSV